MSQTRMFPRVAALLFFVVGVAAHAVSITGTVTNKTTNRPSAGDTVVLVDVQAGMNEAANATTDGSGQYSFDAPGMGPYLIRVTHQGASYFIAAPQGGASGNVTVYDVAAKVDGVAIDADMYLVEAAGGMIRVHERFLVRNTSLPPKTQFSDNTFEVVLPEDAEIDSAAATRPGGLGTNTHLTPLSERDTTHSIRRFNRTRAKRRRSSRFNFTFRTTESTLFTLGYRCRRTISWSTPHKGLNSNPPRDQSSNRLRRIRGFRRFARKTYDRGKGLPSRSPVKGRCLPMHRALERLRKAVWNLALGMEMGSAMVPECGHSDRQSALPILSQNTNGWILASLALLLVVAAGVSLAKEGRSN